MTKYIHLLSRIALSFMVISWRNSSRSQAFTPKEHRGVEHAPSRRIRKLSSQAVSRSHTSEGILSQTSPLSYSLPELADILGGKGRALASWECLRLGVDPLWYFDPSGSKWEKEDVGVLASSGLLRENSGHARSELESLMNGRMSTEGMGRKALEMYRKQFGLIEQSVASLSKLTRCRDGTTKLLLRLNKDGLEVETVIIPWMDRGKSTLCISSQVSCRQACTFCATGRMGKLRDLTTDEILAQLYWAQKICRLAGHCLPEIDNIVYMGLGEPADNVDAVVRSAGIITHPDLYQLAPRRVTISTVAPSPEAFANLAVANVVLAWSVHASQDALRRELVPTTRYTMVELRDGLLQALQSRSKRLRSIMLEVTLINQLNDGEEAALDLVNFCQPLLEAERGIKLVVNLIAWNDIGVQNGPASRYRKSSPAQVLFFQKVLVDHGILCYLRTTRGDEEHAACGMLSTKRAEKFKGNTDSVVSE